MEKLKKKKGKGGGKKQVEPVRGASDSQEIRVNKMTEKSLREVLNLQKK